MYKNLKNDYLKKKTEIKQRIDDFKNNEDYFYELCFCLLTPQSNGLRCDECVQLLKKYNFIKNDVDLVPILKKKTRFHNHKSEYLLNFKENHNLILTKVKKEENKVKNSYELREFLVEHVKGLGYKEASHFLRNIGYLDLAILDRHILKNLKEYNVLKTIPKTLTKKKYLEIEKNFIKFSEKIKIPLNELDLLFWSQETGVIFK